MNLSKILLSSELSKVSKCQEMESQLFTKDEAAPNESFKSIRSGFHVQERAVCLRKVFLFFRIFYKSINDVCVNIFKETGAASVGN